MKYLFVIIAFISSGFLQFGFVTTASAEAKVPVVSSYNTPKNGLFSPDKPINVIGTNLDSVVKTYVISADRNKKETNIPFTKVSAKKIYINLPKDNPLGKGEYDLYIVNDVGTSTGKRINVDLPTVVTDENSGSVVSIDNLSFGGAKKANQYYVLRSNQVILSGRGFNRTGNNIYIKRQGGSITQTITNKAIEKDGTLRFSVPSRLCDTSCEDIRLGTAYEVYIQNKDGVQSQKKVFNTDNEFLITKIETGKFASTIKGPWNNYMATTTGQYNITFLYKNRSTGKIINKKVPVYYKNIIEWKGNLLRKSSVDLSAPDLPEGVSINADLYAVTTKRGSSYQFNLDKTNYIKSLVINNQEGHYSLTTDEFKPFLTNNAAILQLVLDDSFNPDSSNFVNTDTYEVVYEDSPIVSTSTTATDLSAPEGSTVLLESINTDTITAYQAVALKGKNFSKKNSIVIENVRTGEKLEIKDRPSRNKGTQIKFIVPVSFCDYSTTGKGKNKVQNFDCGASNTLRINEKYVVRVKNEKGLSNGIETKTTQKTVVTGITARNIDQYGFQRYNISYAYLSPDNTTKYGDYQVNLHIRNGIVLKNGYQFPAPLEFSYEKGTGLASGVTIPVYLIAKEAISGSLCGDIYNVTSKNKFRLIDTFELKNGQGFQQTPYQNFINKTGGLSSKPGSKYGICSQLIVYNPFEDELTTEEVDGVTLPTLGSTSSTTAAVSGVASSTSPVVPVTPETPVIPTVPTTHVNPTVPNTNTTPANPVSPGRNPKPTPETPVIPTVPTTSATSTTLVTPPAPVVTTTQTPPPVVPQAQEIVVASSGNESSSTECDGKSSCRYIDRVTVEDVGSFIKFSWTTNASPDRLITVQAVKDGKVINLTSNIKGSLYTTLAKPYVVKDAEDNRGSTIISKDKIRTLLAGNGVGIYAIRLRVILSDNSTRFSSASNPAIELRLVSGSVKGIETGPNGVCVSLKGDLQIGSTGDDVFILQNFLNAKGLLSEASGYFGKDTYLALKKFQKDSALPATGYAGSLTRNSLKSLTCDTI